MDRSLLWIATCTLAVMALTACDDSGDESRAAGRTSGECFDAAATLNVEPVSTTEAQQWASDRGMPSPSLPPGVNITSAVIEDDGDTEVLDLYLSHVENWPSGRLRISDAARCSPLDRSALPVIDEVAGADVYLQEDAELLHYVADLDLDDAVAEVTLTWRKDSAPNEQERLELMKSWIEDLID